MHGSCSNPVGSKRAKLASSWHHWPSPCDSNTPPLTPARPTHSHTHTHTHSHTKQVKVYEKDMTAIRGEGKYRGPIQVRAACGGRG